MWQRYLGKVRKFSGTLWLIYPSHCISISIKIGYWYCRSYDKKVGVFLCLTVYSTDSIRSGRDVMLMNPTESAAAAAALNDDLTSRHQ